MNRKILLSLLTIASFILTIQGLSAEGEIEKPERSITVKVFGSASAAPDVVKLNLGVQSMNADLSAAITDNENRMNRIIEVIEKFGIPKTDYRTSNFSVYYQQPYTPDRAPDEGIYNVNNNIYVELHNIDKIGDFVQTALNAGANQFYGIDYAISDPEPLIKKARKLAIENAVRQAEETADYAGVSVGEILNIEEIPYYNGMPLMSEGMVLGAKSNSIISAPGEKTVEVQIAVTFEIK